MSSDSDIKFLKGVGPSLAKRFYAMGIHTTKDLLFYFPRAYDDRRSIPLIANLVVGENQRCKGVVAVIDD